MSRTKKGQKSIGAEFWGRRAGNKGGQATGKAVKVHTHKVERKRAKLDTKLETEDITRLVTCTDCGWRPATTKIIITPNGIVEKLCRHCIEERQS